MKTLGVVGSGQMGGGIAQVIAQSGRNVLLFDSNPTQLTKCRSAIGSRLNKLVEKSKITKEQSDKTLDNIKTVTSITDLKSADCVIEAIVEDTEKKISLFKELDQILPADSIIASNTSSISITKLAACTSRPDKVIGMHFMHPVPVMSLVELVRGLQTSDATYDLILTLANELGKTPITAKFDYPAFIVNRILVPMINEAVFVLMEGISTVEQIDASMKLGTNHPMGPLELADFVGLDTVYSICKILHTELGDDKYRPCPLLAKYVEAGWFGRKTGRGFYKY